MPPGPPPGTMDSGDLGTNCTRPECGCSCRSGKHALRVAGHGNRAGAEPPSSAANSASAARLHHAPCPTPEYLQSPGVSSYPRHPEPSQPFKPETLQTVADSTTRYRKQPFSPHFHSPVKHSTNNSIYYPSRQIKRIVSRSDFVQHRHLRRQRLL